jgi:hypothetical protein
MGWRMVKKFVKFSMPLRLAVEAPSTTKISSILRLKILKTSKLHDRFPEMIAATRGEDQPRVTETPYNASAGPSRQTIK